jgi:hypothetical protein
VVQQAVDEKTEGVTPAADADGGGAFPEVAPAPGEQGRVDGVVRRQEGEHVLEDLVRQRGDKVGASHALQMDAARLLLVGLLVRSWSHGEAEGGCDLYIVEC